MVEAMAISVEEEKRRARERAKQWYLNRTPEQIARDKERERLRFVNMSDEERAKRNERSRQYYQAHKVVTERKEKPKKEIKPKGRIGRPPKPKEEKELASKNRARIYYERRLEKNKTINGMPVKEYAAMMKQKVRNILNY